MGTGEPGQRRKFLAGVGAVALGGCLGGDGQPDSENGVTTEVAVSGNEQLRNDLGVRYPDYDLEDELRILQWGEYWYEAAVPEFEEAFDVSVTVDTVGGLNDRVLEMMDTGELSTYDLLFPSDWVVSVLANDNQIQPLELDKIPNWDNLAQRWVDNAPYDPGQQRYSAPYQWGTTGLGWHEEMVDGPLEDLAYLDSLDAFWIEEFGGQIQMLDLVREVFAVALKRMGESLNTTDSDTIHEAKAMLIEQKSLVDEYGSSTVDVLRNQEATPAQSYSGGAFTAYWALFEDGSSPIAYRIPREGGVVWLDTAVVTVDASSPNAAHAFINYILSATVGAQITNFTFYASPNEAATDQILDEILDNPAIYPPQERQDRLEFIRDVGDAISVYENAWEAVKRA